MEGTPDEFHRANYSSAFYTLMCTLGGRRHREEGFQKSGRKDGVQTMEEYCGLESEIIFLFVAKIWMKRMYLDILLLENQTQEMSYHGS